MAIAFAPADRRALDVVFQEVVHPTRTEEAEVAKLQYSREDRMGNLLKDHT